MARFTEAAMIDKDGFLVGTTPVQEDPMSPGNWLLPPDCVLVDLPKEIKQGYAYKLTKKKTWKEVKIDQKTGQELDPKIEKQKQIEYIKQHSIEYKGNCFELSETFLNAINYVIDESQDRTDKISVRCINLEDMTKELFVELTINDLICLSKLLTEKIYLVYFK